MSTKVINVCIIFSDLAISDIFFNLSSGTETTPTFGSIVQKGKFAASAFFDLVRALKVVDLPTLGNPTIPHLKLINYLPYSKIHQIFYQLIH